MRRPAEHFAHCPRCGQPADPSPPVGPFSCAACRFLLFFNAATAVAAFVLRPDGLALFVRRAREPAKGKLGMVGGFVDAGETAEDALRRETREEVNLELAEIAYLGSYVNEYVYADVLYTTVDLIFVAHAAAVDGVAPLDGVDSIEWRDPQVVELEEIAFPSMRAALQTFRQRTTSP
jgi:ADP-ribose pyrophosphatase YjhB (NUDIX family)